MILWDPHAVATNDLKWPARKIQIALKCVASTEGVQLGVGLVWGVLAILRTDYEFMFAKIKPPLLPPSPGGVGCMEVYTGGAWQHAPVDPLTIQ